MPKRIQRKRTKGWRLPENARCVTRPSRWGNPWRVGDRICDGDGSGFLSPIIALSTSRIHFPAQAVTLFHAYAKARLRVEPEWLAPLRGKDLACYCQPGEPCHADVLLDLANRPEVER